MKLRNQRFKPEEDNYLIKLRNQGKAISTIHNLYCEKYKSIRTKSAIEARIQKLIKSSYNEDIDSIIVKYTRLYPSNLAYAFNQAIIELNENNKTGVSFTALQISGRYYSYIRKNYNILTVGSKEGFTLNIKNSISTREKKQPVLSPVLFLLKEILNLSDKERKDLIEFLNSNN